MSRGSLRLRLLLGGAVSVLVALALSALGLTLLFKHHVERRVDAELAVYLGQLLAGLDRTADGDLTVIQPPADPRFERPLSGLYWQIVGESDATVLRSRSLWDAALDLPRAALADGALHRHRLPGPDDTELLVLERRVTLPARLGGDVIYAAVGLDGADVVAATRAFTADLLPYLALMGAFLTAAAWAQIWVGLKPLAAVRDRLAAIRSGGARRLGAAFPDEVRPLALEVDALLEAHEARIEKARARAADLAHGLKTPLQVLEGDVVRLRSRGETEIAAEIEDVASAMRRHVERELARARIAAGAATARADVREVIDRILAVVSRMPDGKRLRWAIEAPVGLLARIDADDLVEALGNLVENAARHARTQVAIVGSRTEAGIAISVADDGPGIPQDRIPEALTRGGRLDTAGRGAGLGLTIVQDIAAAWEGSLALHNETAGFRAELRLRAP